VAGSEDGDIIFWDSTTKEMVSRVSGHDGVVCWVDTSPKKPGYLISAGLDGTVRIWMDEPENGHENGINGLKLEPNDDLDEVMLNGVEEHGARFDDTPKERSVNGTGSPGGSGSADGSRYQSVDRMED